MIKKVGEFENTNIYESIFFKKGHGLTIPQLGIITYKGAFSEKQDLALIKHEFGHILQYKRIGGLRFYLRIGLPSLWSALKASVVKTYWHQKHPVEMEANQLAYRYFNKPADWNFRQFPIG